MSFELGRCTVTPSVLDALGDRAVALLLSRHFLHDWGDLDEHDERMNELALKNGSRILSCYPVGERRVYVITDAETDVCPACWAGIGVCEPEKGQREGGYHFRTDLPMRRLSTTVLWSDEY